MQQVRHVAATMMQHVATERVPPGIVFRIVLDPDWFGQGRGAIQHTGINQNPET